jgi:6-phosphogluconolactonase (cycloisomerase 2 family)
VRSAYVANSGDNTISQYTMDATGALTPKATPTVESIVGQLNASPTSVTVDPSGKYAYVANSGNEVISQFTIGAGGGLVPMNPATVASGSAGSGPISVTIDPTGTYAYAANSTSNEVAQFTIGAGGKLTPMATATVCLIASPTPPTPPCATGTSSTHVYVADYFGTTISQYTIGSDGSLTAMFTPTVTAGTNPISIAVDLTGRYAYVANFTSANITQFTIAAGALTNPTPVSTDTHPTSIVVDKNGTYAYVASDNGVTQYTITSGALSTPITTSTGAEQPPHSVTIDASGTHLYVTNMNSDSILQFTIGPGGALSSPTKTTGAGGSQPYSITTAVSTQ